MSGFFLYRDTVRAYTLHVGQIERTLNTRLLGWILAAVMVNVALVGANFVESVTRESPTEAFMRQQRIRNAAEDDYRVLQLQTMDKMESEIRTLKSKLKVKP